MKSIILAARRAEFDYYHRGKVFTGRFIPTPDAVIRVMLAAALKLVEVPEPAAHRGRKRSTSRSQNRSHR